MRMYDRLVYNERYRIHSEYAPSMLRSRESRGAADINGQSRWRCYRRGGPFPSLVCAWGAFMLKVQQGAGRERKYVSKCAYPATYVLLLCVAEHWKLSDVEQQTGHAELLC